MIHFLGIDVGGNHVKFGIVDQKGAITHFQRSDTVLLRSDKGFVFNFIQLVKEQLNRHPEVRRVGIGLPGTLDKSRTVAIEVPAIPELDGVPLHQLLCAELPANQFYLENDANAAALGEYQFGTADLPASFVMITLGTGVGSAAIIDRKIFLGGDGNAFELGDIPSRNNRTLEQNIGKAGIIELIETRYAAWGHETCLVKGQLLPETVEAAARQGDPLAEAIFEEVGFILGEALLALIRIVDIKTIVLGGGISAAFDHIVPSTMRCLHERLTPYFKEGLIIKQATLGNHAGIVGAASLCNVQ